MLHEHWKCQPIKAKGQENARELMNLTWKGKEKEREREKEIWNGTPHGPRRFLMNSFQFKLHFSDLPHLSTCIPIFSSEFLSSHSPISLHPLFVKFPFHKNELITDSCSIYLSLTAIYTSCIAGDTCFITFYQLIHIFRLYLPITASLLPGIPNRRYISANLPWQTLLLYYCY